MAPKKTVHEHASGAEYMTKAVGEKHTSKKGHLMEGIVSGMPKRNMPPTIDGIVRGCPKYFSQSLDADVMKVKGSATTQNHAAFGSGAFAQGHM